MSEAVPLDEGLVVRGRVWVFGDGIDTDLMMPQVAMAKPIEEQVRYVFRANRPGWVDLVEPGDILVGGRNFGLGSSRPAPKVFKHMGLAALVAESIGSLFFRNCVNFAFPCMECPGVTGLFKEGETALIDFRTGTVTNVDTGRSLSGTALPPELVAVIRAGGVVPLLQKEGYLEMTSL